MDELHGGAEQSRADQLRYMLLDAAANAYVPDLASFTDEIDEI